VRFGDSMQEVSTCAGKAGRLLGVILRKEQARDLLRGVYALGAVNAQVQLRDETIQFAFAQRLKNRFEMAGCYGWHGSNGPQSQIIERTLRKSLAPTLACAQGNERVACVKFWNCVTIMCLAAEVEAFQGGSRARIVIY
jgi:hypothetical protein